MKPFYGVVVLLISITTFANSNLCFDSEQIKGDSISLKLNNLSKMVASDKDKKGINCSFNGTLVPNNLSIVAYKEPKGICTTEFRNCKEGTLSGSYQYTNCESTKVSNTQSPKSAPATQ